MDGALGGIARTLLRVHDCTEAALAGDVLLPFAWEELLAREAVEAGRPIVHLWRHRRARVLGLRDRKLPLAREAMRVWRDQGCSVGVRHSGGAAVPLDAGVINATLIVPQQQSRQLQQPKQSQQSQQPKVKSTSKANLHGDFAMIAEWIIRAVASLEPKRLRVDIGEIAGAYCPGDYDLSVDGRKFCGIAQRRLTNASLLQAFIDVEGDGAARAREAASFYRHAAGSGEPPLDVREHSTVSLQQCSAHITAASLVTALRRQIDPQSAAPCTSAYDEQQAADIIGRMRERYDQD